MSGPEWSLLEKTELRIERVGLSGANLDDVAAAVADVFGLPHDEVLVIDARDDLLALDILRTTIDAAVVIGRRDALLRALGAVPGVEVGPHTDVCSEGMLGWIGADPVEGAAALERSRAMAAEIDRAITSRAIVFSTGPEVISGQIEDTNKPWITARLRTAGYSVTDGEALPDDRDQIAGALREAAQERGFGLIVTTGGVGAEGKDGTIEALLAVDRDAATPSIFEVQAGHGRHVKAAVRIGVGEAGGAVIACLPGPHSEVRLGIEALVTGISHQAAKDELADAVATVLRERLRHSHGVSA